LVCVHWCVHWCVHCFVIVCQWAGEVTAWVPVAAVPNLISWLANVNSGHSLAQWQHLSSIAGFRGCF